MVGIYKFFWSEGKLCFYPLMPCFITSYIPPISIIFLSIFVFLSIKFYKKYAENLFIKVSLWMNVLSLIVSIVLIVLTAFSFSIFFVIFSCIPILLVLLGALFISFVFFLIGHHKAKNKTQEFAGEVSTIKPLIIILFLFVIVFIFSFLILLNSLVRGSCHFQKNCEQLTQNECEQMPKENPICLWINNQCKSAGCSYFSNDESLCQSHYEDMGCTVRKYSFTSQKETQTKETKTTDCVRTSCFNFRDSKSSCEKAPKFMKCKWEISRQTKKYTCEDYANSDSEKVRLNKVFCDYDSLVKCNIHKNCEWHAYLFPSSL